MINNSNEDYHLMSKVIELTKDYFILSDGRQYQHQFEIDENMSIEEFQILLDKSEIIINDLINGLTDYL